MSLPELTLEQKTLFNETRQPDLWGWLTCFLVISNVSIIGRLWGTWKSVSTRSQVIAEDLFIALSGILLNAIIANLMVATHYGLGLHFYTVNAKDENYPSNLSNTFKHVWITMVLMSGFFLCIKMTLLLFYNRLFLCVSTTLRVFWWANVVYVVLCFIGGTGFYLFQCQPVQWYFLQYFSRFGKPVPGGVTGQCDATTVLHVAMPMIFSLISDVALLILPIWAISRLRLERKKRLGLMAVFGIGLVACLLELARVLALLIDTDDKTDPSWGVAVFLILTAAEETTAVVCACLPVIGPHIYKYFRGFHGRTIHSHSYGKNGAPSLDFIGRPRSGSRNWPSKQSFKRVMSVNHIPTTLGGLTRLDPAEIGDHIHLTSIESNRPKSSPTSSDADFDIAMANHEENIGRRKLQFQGATGNPTASREEELPLSSTILVRTDVAVEVGERIRLPSSKT